MVFGLAAISGPFPYDLLRVWGEMALFFLVSSSVDSPPTFHHELVTRWTRRGDDPERGVDLTRTAVTVGSSSRTILDFHNIVSLRYPYDPQNAKEYPEH